MSDTIVIMSYNNDKLTPKLLKLQAEGKKAGDMSKFDSYLKTFQKSVAWHKAHPTGAGSKKKPVSKKSAPKKKAVKKQVQASLTPQTKALQKIAKANLSSA